jgi:uncharacterized protein DUF6455
MLRRVTEDAGPLVQMLSGLGVEPRALVHRPPGELAQAVQNCLECLDQEVCSETASQGGQLSQAPGFCSNRAWITELRGSTPSRSVALKRGTGRPVSW